ncbi:cog8p [Saccharomyces arboricola H-6]|uniref:Conserved oligomeric Golgi complex subunit 8 n=1 Tax=Saccharomyces arboricola (strain H-6 / AS 2.3317 / CBS 10644) TaxID=1160507 RepID=J8Q1H9_SACAR|nr:cog8p [Saccharomyces arboricola H-6]
MELILNTLVPDDLTKDQRQLNLAFLQEILQSNTKEYETYFSSRAVPGSITEDIAEIDAELSALDRNIRKSLLENKSQIIDDILGNDDRVQLEEISKSLEQLWELDAKINKTTDEDTVNDTTNEAFSLDDFLEHDNESIGSNDNTITEGDNAARKRKKDEFHEALGRLRSRLLTKGDDKSETRSDTLVTVLENLSGITDVMELPFLARTCIRTGHYQEAVMLYTHTISLRSRFPGSSIVDEVYQKVLNEISTTMSSGLVKLLSTNVSVNSLKKILKYLNSIPPFDGKTNKSLLSIFLAMRYKFITEEVASYSLDIESSNKSLVEMMVKRKVEVLREHVYMSLNVFVKNFLYDTSDLEIPFPEELKTVALETNGCSKGEKEEKEVDKEGSKEEDSEVDNEVDNEVVREESKEESKGESKEESKGESKEESKGESKEENKDEDSEVGKEEDKEEGSEEGSEEESREVGREEDKQEDKEEKEEKELRVDVETTPDEPTKKSPPLKRENKIPTNAIMLQFVDKCVSYILNDLIRHLGDIKLSDSVCLQLVYCSFRFSDLNRNYHHLFLNKISDTNLFTTEQLAHAINKRAELASKYIYS